MSAAYCGERSWLCGLKLFRRKLEDRLNRRFELDTNDEETPAAGADGTPVLHDGPDDRVPAEGEAHAVADLQSIPSTD
jgi:hypothetical protein